MNGTSFNKALAHHEITREHNPLLRKVATFRDDGQRAGERVARPDIAERS